MYRRYEDPYKLQSMIEKEEEKLAHMIEDGEDDDAIYDQTIWIHELRDRENFAWQDEEYDESYAQYEWEEVIG